MATIGQGANSTFGLDFEDVIGTSPGTPDVRQLAFVSENIRATRATVRNESLSGDANPRDAVLARSDVAGDLVIIPQLVNLPLLTKWITGDLTSTGSTDYVHTSKYGKATTSMVSAVLDFMFDLDTNLYKRVNGACVETFSGEITDAGFLQFSLGVAGFATSKQTTALDATMTDMTADATFNHSLILAADCKINGTATTRLASLSWNLNTNLAKDIYPVAQGSTRAALPRGVASCTGSFKVYIDDATFWDLALAAAGSYVAIDMKWTIAANKYFQLTFPRALISRTDPTISGPGALTAEFTFEASKDGTAGTCLTMVTGNQSAGTVYA